MALALSIAGIGKQALTDIPQQFPAVASTAGVANIYFLVAGLIFVGGVIGLLVGLFRLVRK